jgi:pantoate--beta-alanine ligase
VLLKKFMIIIKTINEARSELKNLREHSREIGFVPTMGALHAGHAKLIEISARENDATVVSIFLNPMQFGENEDYDAYPNTLEADLRVCENAGAEMVFIPRANEIYPDDFSTWVDMDGLTDVLCGRSRPGHFRGVMTVVTKLLNIIKPDRAYFGEKDAQQLAVIRKLVRDLNMDVEIIGCPTVRDSDGLALSSRNAYLSPKEREAARCISYTLTQAREIISPLALSDNDAEKSRAISVIREIIGGEPLAKLEYAEMLDADTLGELTDKTERALIAVAAYIGETRLIDNVILRWNL